MSLIAELARAKSEEDVKDAYIKALGLKRYTKGLIDIRTEEIWFESKDAPTPPILMFAQLLFYVRDARKKGEPIPPFLAVIDREKAAIMETARALPILDDKSIRWPKSGSKAESNQKQVKHLDRPPLGCKVLSPSKMYGLFLIRYWTANCDPRCLSMAFCSVSPLVR